MFRIDNQKIYEYISPNDPDKTNPTVFYLRVLDPISYTEVTKALTFKSNDEFGKSCNMSEGAAFMLALVKFGLVDWKNLQDKNGKEIPFDKKVIELSSGDDVMQYAVPSMETIAMLPQVLLFELGGEISRLLDIFDMEESEDIEID